MKKFFVILLFFNLVAHCFSQTETKTNSQARDVVGLGYQIGGYTLLGFDIEKRVSDMLGVHFGGGFLGYTAGFKFHFKPTKNSSFINLSFKDGGFGQIRVIATEFGGRWQFLEEKPAGLLYQIGVARILAIDEWLEYRLFKSRGNPPPLMLSAGIGLSW